VARRYAQRFAPARSTHRRAGHSKRLYEWLAELRTRPAREPLPARSQLVAARWRKAWGCSHLPRGSPALRLPRCRI